MVFALRLLLLAIGLGGSLGGGIAWAGSLVEFPNVSETEPKLLGYLARPAGDGPFPAVVVLHGCAGFSAGGSLQLADQLQDWGYVAQASFVARTAGCAKIKIQSHPLFPQVDAPSPKFVFRS